MPPITGNAKRRATAKDRATAKRTKENDGGDDENADADTENATNNSEKTGEALSPGNEANEGNEGNGPGDAALPTTGRKKRKERDEEVRAMLGSGGDKTLI